MLTNIFYYNHYKPYILRNEEVGSVSPKRKKIAAKEQLVDNYKVLMNKSMRNDVLGYIRDVSSSVVGAKDASKNIIRNMEDFNKNVYKRGYNTAKEWISEDLETFAEQYNSSVDFLSRQKHSQALANFAENLAHKVESGIKDMDELGLSLSENGKLSYNKELFNELDENRINRAIGSNIGIFSDIYNDTTDVLTEPLTEHMRFKGLGYYYNYKLGTIESDTFKIIESGMLIDKVV